MSVARAKVTTVKAVTGVVQRSKMASAHNSRAYELRFKLEKFLLKNAHALKENENYLSHRPSFIPQEIVGKNVQKNLGIVQKWRSISHFNQI